MAIQRGITHTDEYVVRFGEDGWAKYIDVLGNRKANCLRILSQLVKRSGFLSDFQTYVGVGWVGGGNRIPRYYFPIGLCPTNDEGKQVYDPITMTGRGYDIHEERMRSVTATEAALCVWILGIAISDSTIDNMCAIFDSDAIIHFLLYV